MPNVVPLPEAQLEQLAEDDPEMLAQVVKQLHDSAQAERQARLNEENES
jgi:hypothetical protein